MQRSNLDSTKLRVIKQGDTVRIGNHYGKVTRVRGGQCKVDWLGGKKGSAEFCNDLTVTGAIRYAPLPHSTPTKQCPDCFGAGCNECNNTGKIEV